MTQFRFNVNVFDWCVEVEALPYDVDDNGDIVNLDYRNVKRVRIEDCTDEYSEDILHGQKSLTLIHQGVSLVTFNNVQNSVQGVSNTLNGSDDFDYIEGLFSDSILSAASARVMSSLKKAHVSPPHKGGF